MSEDPIFHVKPAIAASAGVNAERYRLMCNHAARDTEHFWEEQASRLDWIHFPTMMKNTSFEDDVSIRWFEDGTLNVSVNCLDRHLRRARRPGGDHLGGRRSRP